MKIENVDAYLKIAIAAAVLFVAYKVWRGAADIYTSAADTVSNAVGMITGANAKELGDILNAALKAKGQNPDDYLLMFPPPVSGQKLPAGSWRVTYQGKDYYFTKKGVSPIFSL